MGSKHRDDPRVLRKYREVAMHHEERTGNKVVHDKWRAPLQIA